MPQQKQTIAVDDELGNVRQALEEQGYQVVSIHDAQTPNAYVLSGMDVNIAGIQNIIQGVPVIDASGLSAEDIVQEVSERTARLNDGAEADNAELRNMRRS